MRPIHDPRELTPQKRRQEVATLFAAGILRLHRRGLLVGDSDRRPGPENCPESSQEGLELSGNPRLSVRAG